MKRSLISAALLTLALAALAHAQSGSTDSQVSGQGTGAAGSSQGNASANASATAEANANADAAFLRLAEEVRNKGAKVSAEARAKAQARLEATAKGVDEEAAKGEDKVASRLAAELGVTQEALMAEKTELGVSWGQLMIIHTLMANAKTEVTAQQLADMHSGGMGWGQIAAGLGLKLGEVVSAVSSEGRVASGQVQADGKVAVIHGEGAKAGLGLGAGMGVQAGRNKAGLEVGTHAGAKVGPRR